MFWILLTSSLSFAQTATDTGPTPPASPPAVESAQPKSSTAGTPSPTIGPLLSTTLAVEEARLRVVIRAVAEQWNEPAIATVYQQGGLLGGIGIVVPIWDDLSLDVEFVYRRFTQGGGAAEAESNGYKLQILPISFIPEYKFALNGPMHGFVGLGGAYTVFTEEATLDEVTELSVITGARLASEFRMGIRVDTGLVTQLPSAIAQGGIQSLEIELYGARRMQLPRSTERLDLGAWRGSIGLGMRF